MRTVLLADEDPKTQSLLVAALERWGYIAVVALDEASILEQAIDGEIGLIIVSSTLPGLCGFDLCHRLRQAPATADIPLVYLAPVIDDAVRAQCRQAKVDDYLRKPVQLGEFLITVHRYIPYGGM